MRHSRATGAFRSVEHKVIDDEVIVLGQPSAEGFAKQQVRSALLNREGPDASQPATRLNPLPRAPLKKPATECTAAPGAAEHPVTDKQLAFLEMIARGSDPLWLTASPSRTAGDLISCFASKQAAEGCFCVMKNSVIPTEMQVSSEESRQSVIKNTRGGNSLNLRRFSSFNTLLLPARFPRCDRQEPVLDVLKLVRVLLKTSLGC